MGYEIDLNKRKNYRSLAFWSWNGKMEDSEVVRQIRDFAANGYGGFFIHSRAGLEISYMEDAWFHACGIAVEEAEKVGLSVWIYDEDGWPSGFAGGIIPVKGEEFQFKTMEFKIIREGDAIPEKAIAGYRQNKESCGGTYEKTSLEDAQLVIYYKTDAHYVDLLNPDVTDAFLQSTHEVYKTHFSQYFGTTIKGCFADEPQLNNAGYTWSFELPAFYREATGRDLLEELWLLQEQSPQGDAMRHDYWKAVGLLYRHSFTEKIANWCKANHLEFTGHFACEDGLCDQISSNGGVMKMYPLMQLPGIDYLGRRIASPVLMKQVSSVAEQYGKDRVLSESFGCSGWNLSFAEMMWMWGYQAVLGINLPCLHLSAYTIKGVRKRDYPVFFSYQEPWWDQFKMVNDAFSGLSLLLAQGESDHHVLVVSPLSGMLMNADRPGYSWEEKQISCQYRMLIENLLNIQIGFDIGDEMLIQEDAKIHDSRFVLGNKSYDTVFVCQTDSTFHSSVDLYRTFIEKGGRLIFINQLPTHVDGKPSFVYQEEVFQNACLIQNRQDLLRKYFDFSKFNRTITFQPQWENKISEGVYVRIREYNNCKIAYIWNKSPDSIKKLTGFIQGNYQVEQLDPRKEDLLKGESIQARYNEARSSFDLVLPEKGSALLYLRPLDDFMQISNNSGFNITEKQRVADWEISCQDRNCLTLDYASFSIDGGEFSTPKPVIHLQDEIYDRLSETGTPARVMLRYDFEVALDADLTKMNISIAAETEQCKEIILNESSIIDKTSGWWIDHSILEYPAKSLVVHGKNRIVVSYDMPVWKQTINLEQVFETERNRFHYPVGFEAIYLRGDFSVQPQGAVCDCSTFLSVKNGSFILKNADSSFQNNELTSQGLWFYRGNMIYKTRHTFPDYSDSVRYFLEWAENCFVLSTVYLNGRRLESMISPPYRCNITSALKTGENDIQIIFHGSNRNLFGPHHHIKGEPNFVGPNIFLGKKGYEDFVSPDITAKDTWSNSYHFVKTQIEAGIWLVKEENASIKT